MVETENMLLSSVGKYMEQLESSFLRDMEYGLVKPVGTLAVNIG